MQKPSECITDTTPSSIEWINANKNPPTVEGEILFIAKFGLTSERIGLALPKKGIVLLSHTEIDIKDLLYWFPMPELPVMAWVTERL